MLISYVTMVLRHLQGCITVIWISDYIWISQAFLFWPFFHSKIWYRVPHCSCVKICRIKDSTAKNKNIVQIQSTHQLHKKPKICWSSSSSGHYAATCSRFWTFISTSCVAVIIVDYSCYALDALSLNFSLSLSTAHSAMLLSLLLFSFKPGIFVLG